MNTQDDGSLNFLNIPPDASNKQFHSQEVSQQALINTSFWIVDYAKNVHTRYGDDRYLVKCKRELTDVESQSFKFFTGSKSIKYILDKIDELDAFPRKVTMRVKGNCYFIE